MSDKQKKLLALIEKLLPSMSEMEQEKLLAFGEGMAFTDGIVNKGGTKRK